MLTSRPPSHRRPPRSSCPRPAGRCLECEPAACAAHPAPKVRRDARWFYEPRSSFACPRLSTSPIQPCPPPCAMWLRAAVGCGAPRPSLRFRHAPSATASPRAGRAQAAHRCWAAPTRAERVAALRASVGVRTAVPPRARFASGASLRAPACVRGAPREVAASPPRFARTTPRPASANAFASLTPPREPPAPFAFPSRAAAFRFRRRPATPCRLALPTSPTARLRRGMALDARGPVSSKGALRRSLATPRLGRNFTQREESGSKKT